MRDSGPRKRDVRLARTEMRPRDGGLTAASRVQSSGGRPAMRDASPLHLSGPAVIRLSDRQPMTAQRQMNAPGAPTISNAPSGSMTNCTRRRTLSTT